MPARRYASGRLSAAAARSVERVLSAAAELVAEDSFHTATMDDLARCAGGPEMRALREAQNIEDPVAALDGLLEAGCDLWEKEGYIMVQLKAILVLEPDATAIIDAQHEDQRSGMQSLARRL